MGSEPNDGEAAVLAELTARASRSRTLGVRAGLAVGVLGALPGFYATTALQWWLLGDYALTVISALGAATVLFGSVLAGKLISDAAWRAGRDALCRSLARAHGVPEQTVSELAAVLDG